ncbi:MAG: ATP-binding cassette domain-containing protein [Oscillibacter sp.]|jgi:molybdate transport system ATP-binding protein|nr:ATP-binding cassette domain-containing protein [Oscillibacter sp.]
MGLIVDIRKKLGGFTLNVQLEAGNEYLALLGASGCGKSVTLKCIAGILKPDAGHIELDGTVLFDSARHINLPPQKRQVGYLFQQYALFPNMTVRENISVAVREKEGREETADAYLRRFRLTDVEHQRPRQLSGGQSQRTALARMLAAKPKAILLDEPFSALDSYLKYQLEMELSDTLKAFSGPVLWVSHDRGEVWRNCACVCVIDHGRSEKVVSMQELFRAPVTASAAQLSGCKNYVTIVPQGDRIQIPAWNAVLFCGQTVPPDCTGAGIRSHHVHFAEGTEENRLTCSVERVIDDVFETIVLLKIDGSAPDAPFLRMELPKEVWNAKQGQTSLTVTVSPQDILLLK